MYKTLTKVYIYHNMAFLPWVCIKLAMLFIGWLHSSHLPPFAKSRQMSSLRNIAAHIHRTLGGIGTTRWHKPADEGTAESIFCG